MWESAVRCKPLRDWPAATGLRATTTSSELPSLRVWWLKLSYYLRCTTRANVSLRLLVRPHSTPTAPQRIVHSLPPLVISRKVFYLMEMGWDQPCKVFLINGLSSKYSIHATYD